MISRIGLRRWLARGLRVGFVLGFVLCVVLWLVFQHKPGWYRPGVATEATIHLAQAETAALADLIGDNLVRGVPFDVTLVDHRVNGWLACLHRIVPGDHYELPPELTEPALRFDDGMVRVGAHFSDNGWRVILNAAFRVQLSDGGRSIRISLDQVRGGSLTAPRWLLERLLERYGPRATSGSESARTGRAEPGLFDSLSMKVQSVDDLFDGVTIRNRFVWPNGKRPFRVDSIRMDAGSTRIRIEPL